MYICINETEDGIILEIEHSPTGKCENTIDIRPEQHAAIEEFLATMTDDRRPLKGSSEESIRPKRGEIIPSWMQRHK